MFCILSFYKRWTIFKHGTTKFSTGPRTCGCLSRYWSSRALKLAYISHGRLFCEKIYNSFLSSLSRRVICFCDWSVTQLMSTIWNTIKLIFMFYAIYYSNISHLSWAFRANNLLIHLLSKCQYYVYVTYICIRCYE